MILLPLQSCKMTVTFRVEPARARSERLTKKRYRRKKFDQKLFAVVLVILMVV